MTMSDTINSVTTPGANAMLSATGVQANNAVDQKTFLKLMIAQFKNQDPSKPKDPSEFLSQLAQFSTVSGIQEMQSSIGALSDSLRAQSVLGGAVMVGREVLAPGGQVAVGANQTVTGGFETPPGATMIDVQIKDAAGQLVRHMSVPAKMGLTSFSWDGLTDRGQAAGPGVYAISGTAGVGAASQAAPTFINARVDSVTIDPATRGLTLNTGSLGSISLNDVRQIM